MRQNSGRVPASGLRRLSGRLAALSAACALLLALLMGCSGEKPALSSAGVMHEEEFGGVYVASTIEDFNRLGFQYGDSVRVSFSNGFVLEDLPYYNGYYTQTGEPLLVAYPGYPYIKVGINNGADLWITAGLKEGDTAEITLAERGKYAAVQRARDISYTDLRKDYPDDETFANFRMIRVGRIREGILYRAASPLDDQHGRAAYVDALISRAGVRFILDLADDRGKIEGYLSDPGFASPYARSLFEDGKIYPAALNMNYGSEEFRGKITAGFAAMAEEEGPYLLHCTEGKDRTGFACILIEALAGADLEEITDDYMLTYRNYYGISGTHEKEKYDVIRENVLDPMIRTVAQGAEDLSGADLEKGAEEYLTAGGMSRETLDRLRARLTGNETGR